MTKSPTKDAARALADLPATQHRRNVGGSDGAGLCVPTSVWHCSLWQSVSDLYDLRAYTEKRPGGSYPEKFEQTLAGYCKSKGIACPGYVQHTGGDDEFLDLALKTGRMIGVTYCGVDGAGRYGNEVIAHMVNLVHLDGSLAAIVDNNFPGTWLWMSRGDFLARWRGVQPSGKPWVGRDARGRTFPIGGGWAIVLLGPPPAPYPAAPTATRFDMLRNEGAELAQFRYAQPQDCPNGKCPLQPGAPQGFAPLFQFPPPAVVPAQMPARYTVKDLPPATSFPREPAPRAGFYWKNVPGRGDCWIEDNGAPFDWGVQPGGKWGWVPREAPPVIEAPTPPARPEQKAEVPAGAEEPAVPVQADYPPGGVDSQRLTTERRWHVNGERVTKAEAHAALSLTDDSDRWHLAVVGEPGFQRKLRDDIATLPAATRAKLHVQTYAPTDWQVAQFRLGAGVTLRQPARNRIGADVGTCPVEEYNAAKLAELVTAPAGPTPAPAPAPQPTPKEPTPAPAPKVDPAPNIGPAPTPTPAPTEPAAPNSPAALLILGALAALVWWLTR